VDASEAVRGRTFCGMIVAVTSAFPDPLLHPIVFSTPRRLSTVTAWQEHIPFAMYLVDVLRPRTLVELGTHYGDSYCAFCQAVAELQLPTAAFAVDTWQGDEHSGHYGQDVLRDLRAHHDPLYGGFSELLESSFDDALPRFADGSIDLLHVDGCHLYEAVRHDFESWLPKLSPRGAVLLHDTASRIDGFGVWRLLDELRGRYPCLEFTHASGLGLVLAGREPAPELAALTRLEGEELAGFRALFEALGRSVRCVGEVERAVAEQERLRRLLEDQTAATAHQGELAAAQEARAVELERRVEEISNARLLRLGRWVRPGPGGRRRR
jgi:hypothetical protein